MKDSFLIGNEIIEQALAEVNADWNRDTMMNLVHAIQQRMAADGHLLLPVEFPDPEDPNTFRMRGIPDDAGELYLACFTSEEELHKGEPTAVISQFIDVFLEAVIDFDDVSGIIINPFGLTCRLPKGVLQIVLEAKKPSEDDYKRENFLLEKAIHFATSRHAGQLRKGTTVPYIVHPLETMQILRSMNADTNLLIAGLLHDTIEDTETTIDEIVETFGTDVAALVGGHSEDKSKTWKQRKTHAIRELAGASRRMKMLVMADKVSNLRSMAADYRTVGDELWKRFNAPVEKQAWYYSGIQDSLCEMQNDPDASPVYWEMVGLFKDLFVEYYHVKEFCPPGYEEEYLLQVCLDGTAYRLDKRDPEWQKIQYRDGLIEEDDILLSRQDAERLEDEWNKTFWECVDRDLYARTCKLMDAESCTAEIQILNRQLTLTGEDSGPACEKPGGQERCEYRVALDEDNTVRMLARLRVKYGTETDLESIFVKEFGRRTPSKKLMDFCEKNQVQYSFSSH